MAVSGDVDINLLAQAVTLPNQGKLVDFAFGKKFPVDEITVSALKVDDLGYIQVPVSLQDAGKLMDLLSAKQNLTGLEHCISTTPENFDISSLVASHLKLPSDVMKVQAKLEKVVVYDTKCHYECSYNSKKEFGTFGTATLQLPVEGGHEGGNLKVEYKGRSHVFDNAENSNHHFYLSAYYHNCRPVTEPLKKGYKILLVFNLNWTNAKMMIPQDFPAFLTALKRTTRVLKSWIPDGTLDQDEASEDEASDDDDEWQDVDSEDSSNSDDESDDEYEHCYMHHCALEDNVLFFVLEEKYGENALAFKNLKGNDRNLAHLLQSCPFLDVHLVQVVLKSENMEYNGMSRTATEARSNKISHWIDSNDVIRKLSLDINWKDQRVGPYRDMFHPGNSSPDKEIRVRATDEDDVSALDYMTMLLNFMQPNHGPVVPVRRKSYYFRSAMVIWPKQQSTKIYCRHGLSSLLDQLEKSTSSAELMEEVKQSVLEKLEEIVSFCCVEPHKAWKYTEDRMCGTKQYLMKKGVLTKRLLSLCTTLQAHEEGLNLLKMLGKSFRDGSQFSNNETYEGIQNEQVAKAIADFTAQLPDWSDCAPIMLQLISPKRITDQFKQILKLAEYLAQINCMEGVEIVENCISSSVSQLPKFDTKLLSSYITSKGWNEMKSPLKMIILNACAALVESEISRILRVLESKKSDSSDLKLKISKCTQLFLLIEKNRLDAVQKNVADAFLPLFTKLSTIQLMNFLLELHKSEGKGPSSLKSYPICMDWYRIASRILVSREDFVSIVTGESAIKIMNCLIWLDDEESWHSFADRICAFFDSNQSQLFVQVYLKNVHVQEALLNSIPAFASFNRIVGHLGEQSKLLKDPSTFSWVQPTAKVPNYPDVEAFLRSSEEKATFSNLFSGHEAARQFARELEADGPKKGCGVRVTICGDKNVVRCTIAKLRSYHDVVVKDFQKMKSELEQLVKLHQRVLEDRGQSK